MGKILDLDAVVPDNRQVKLGGKIYDLPGDIKAPRFLRLYKMREQAEQSAAGEVEETVGILETMYKEMVDLFQVHQPELKDLDISFDQIAVLFTNVVDSYAEDEEPVPLEPTTTSKKNSKRSVSPKPGKTQMSPSLKSSPS